MGNLTRGVAVITLLGCSAATAQVVRPTAPVPVLRPTIKLPPTAPATPGPVLSSGHSTIPANIRTGALTVTGTAAGSEPTPSEPVTIAEARDFNFTVPLRISHLPATFTDAEIECMVSMAVNPQHPDPMALDHRVANGLNSVHLNNGGYIGDVAVHPFTDAGYDPTTGQIYYCQVTLVGTDRSQVFRARPMKRYPAAPWSFEPPVPTAVPPQPDARGIIP